MSLDAPGWPDPTGEARRQIEICNACRYCEGYCSVFPAITRQRVFADADIIQFANLCHNCRACYHACQYTAPHEFDLNLPRALAEVRAESWERHAWPAGLAPVLQRHGMVMGAALVAGIAILWSVLAAWKPVAGDGFYAYLSHAAMVAIFAPAFLLPLGATGIGLRRYWREIGGASVSRADLVAAVRHAAELRDLSGGQGQGCNFEKGDRYSQARRMAHQATMWGFLLCFAATVSATLMHYGLGWHAPYSLLSLPKLLGLPGGLLLTAGTMELARLKLRAARALGAPDRWGGEMGFVMLLGGTGLTGLLLYAATGTSLVPALLALHLGFVLAFFLTVPYTKMVHGFYRFAALVRDVQTRRAETARPQSGR